MCNRRRKEAELPMKNKRKRSCLQRWRRLQYSLRNRTTATTERANKASLQGTICFQLDPKIPFLSLPSRLLTVSWIISHCYVFSLCKRCCSVCLIPHAYRSIITKVPIKWLFKWGGAELGRGGHQECLRAECSVTTGGLSKCSNSHNRLM